MTLILNSKEKVYKFRQYTIYISDNVRLMIEKRELKLSWIERLYLKASSK